MQERIKNESDSERLRNTVERMIEEMEETRNKILTDIRGLEDKMVERKVALLGAENMIQGYRERLEQLKIESLKNQI
jgi:hypothetical protein